MNDIEFYKSFRFKEYTYDRPGGANNLAGVPLHFIGYLKRGHGTLISDNGRIDLLTGDLFYIPKGCKYRSYWFGDESTVFDSLGFEYFPLSDKNGFVMQKIEWTEEISTLYSPFLMSKELNATSIGFLYKLLGALEKIMTESPVSKKKSIVDKAISMINDDPSLTMAEHAARLGISESLLYSYFRSELGKKPNLVRQEALCKNAISLLTTTNLKIEEICDKVGISSASYFRKLLFAITGKTPSEIRKSSASL